MFNRSWLSADSELHLCPSASRPPPGGPVHWGGTFHAYTIGRLAPTAPERNDVIGYGSYAVNVWTRAVARDIWEIPSWRSCDIRGASRVPAFFDCAVMTGGGLRHSDRPPAYEYALSAECSYPDTVSPVCMNRHSEAINMLFMDWSVRKVGLKELWTLKWHPDFNTAGPWTNAGGVQPEDWPQWMRKFKDY